MELGLAFWGFFPIHQTSIGAVYLGRAERQEIINTLDGRSRRGTCMSLHMRYGTSSALRLCPRLSTDRGGSHARLSCARAPVWSFEDWARWWLRGIWACHSLNPGPSMTFLQLFGQLASNCAHQLTFTRW